MRKNVQSLGTLLAFILSVGLMALPPAKAAVMITAKQSGLGVEFTSTGTLDVSGLGQPFAAASTSGWIDPAGGALSLGPVNNAFTTDFDLYAMATAQSLPAFGSTGFTFGTFGSGTPWRIDGTELSVPPGYDGSTDLAATLVFAGQSFASLGLELGGFQATLKNGDTISLAVVPLPAALPLFGAGLAGLALLRHRRRLAQSGAEKSNLGAAADAS